MNCDKCRNLKSKCRECFELDRESIDPDLTMRGRLIIKDKIDHPAMAEYFNTILTLDRVLAADIALADWNKARLKSGPEYAAPVPIILDFTHPSPSEESRSDLPDDTTQVYWCLICGNPADDFVECCDQCEDSFTQGPDPNNHWPPCNCDSCKRQGYV